MNKVSTIAILLAVSLVVVLGSTPTPGTGFTFTDPFELNMGIFEKANDKHGNSIL